MPRSAFESSRLITRFITLSMRSCVALERPSTPVALLAFRLSLYSRMAAAKTRAIGSRVSAPKAFDRSSSVRPDQNVSSNAVARRFNMANMINLSTATTHDQMEASANKIITDLTTQSARKKSDTKEKSPLWTSAKGLA